MTEKDVKRLRAVYKTDHRGLGEYFAYEIYIFLGVPDSHAEVNFSRVFDELPKVCPVDMEPSELSICLRDHIVTSSFFVLHGGEHTLHDSVLTTETSLAKAAKNYVDDSPTFPEGLRKRLHANIRAEKIVV